MVSSTKSITYAASIAIQVEACLTEAITESKLFEFSFTNCSDAIYTKSELLVDDEGRPQQLPWEDWRDGEELLTSGGGEGDVTAGDADFEGVVGWSTNWFPNTRPNRNRRAR